MAEVEIALSAAPNTGKTTLFNQLTGASQTTGNWPGVTVARKEGHFRLGEFDVRLVDLPGAYSITPTTLEERVVREYLLESPPDLVLNVLDAGNLYRGLGLTLQLALTGLPMVVAVNMMDEARAQGLEIDLDALASHLGVPVVGISARSGEGIERLREVLLETLREPRRGHHVPHISLPGTLEEEIARIARAVEQNQPDLGLDDAFVAVRLMEGGDAASHFVRRYPSLQAVAAEAEQARDRAEQILGQDLPTTCAQCRYNAARGLVKEVVHSPVSMPRGVADRVDALLLHPWFGIPIFFLVMLLLYQGVFALGAPVQEWLGGVVESFQGWLNGGFDTIGAPELLRSLVVDGVVAGVGVVLSFLPILVLFFSLLSLIEDTGYIARAAFLMDRAMHMLRLDGKAFISLLLGFGCNVPAVMGTRILSSRHNRVLAMLLIPFTLCSARLQVFLFLATILFTPTAAPWVLTGLYFTSFLVIFLVGLLLRPIHFGEPEPFIMELPPYRLPLPRSVWLRAWQEVRGFISRAGSLIVMGVVAIWVLTNLPPGATPGSADTIAGKIGMALAPIFEPIGIGWVETVALFFGFIAKEIFIGALAVVYGTSDLAGTVAARMTPLQGLSLMVFTLLYTPCVATLASIQAEAASWRVTLLSVGLGLGLAWVCAFLVYNAGRLLGFS